MKYQYRITYKKKETLRYTSNLDVHKIWERSLRRSKLPLAYSEGFHPQPRIQQASPLPLGFLSNYEIIDIYLTEEFNTANLQENIQANLPKGFEVITLEAILEKEPALQVQVKAAEYMVEFLDPVSFSELTQKVKQILSKSSIMRIRRKKEYDLRPLILELYPSEIGKQATLTIKLRSEQGATGRPEEVLSEIGYNLEDLRITRTMIYKSIA